MQPVLSQGYFHFLVASVWALSPIISMSVYYSIFLSGVPGFQCVGPVCHQVHAARDVQSAAVSAEITAVCHGGCGGAEQPHPVSTSSSTSLQHTIYTILWPWKVLRNLMCYSHQKRTCVSVIFLLCSKTSRLFTVVVFNRNANVSITLTVITVSLKKCFSCHNLNTPHEPCQNHVHDLSPT